MGKRNGLIAVRIIRCNGSDEEHQIARSIAMNWIQRMIDAPQALDVVNLRDGRVMLVDDTGLVDGKPVNSIATALYHSVCRPGTTNPIAGDVAIALDKDFA